MHVTVSTSNSERPVDHAAGFFFFFATSPATSWHLDLIVVKMYSGNNDCKVYVGNLPSDIRARDLEDLFYKYGKIVDVDLHNRRGPPFAFIEFEDPR